MCDPGSMFLATMATGAMSSATSYAASSADYASKSAAWTQNVVNSEAAARDEDKQIIGNQLADQAKTNQQKQISYITQAEKQSQVSVGAAEGNVSGSNAVDNILQDIATKSEVNRGYADENYKFMVSDAQMKLNSVNDTEQSRINSVPVPQAPSLLGPLASFAGTGVKAFGTYSNATQGASTGDA